MKRARAARSTTRRMVPLKLQIRAQPLGATPLLTDYLAADPALAAFYYGHPFDGAAYDRKATAVARRFGAGRRAAIASALVPVSEAARVKLARVVEEDGFVVTTGQQPGLFGGPLYTLYKALTAVRLAEALEARLQQPVLPVFWVAAEDHDWDEANHTFVAGEDDVPVRLAIGRPADAPAASMARQPLGQDATRALHRLESLLPQGPDTPRLIARLRAVYTPDRTVAEAFRELLAELLAAFPVCTISAADPRLKELSAPLLRAELERNDEHMVAVARQTQRLVNLGYAAQVELEAGATNVHFEDAAGRERVLRRGDAFRLRRTKRRYTLEQLLARLDAEPAALSPGALLRPVIESAVLPTLAYVAGPAETAYFAQTGCLFRSHDVEPPLVYPRAAFQLIEPRIARLLSKLGLRAEEIDADAATLSRTHIDASLPEATVAALAALRLDTAEAWSRLRSAARPIDRTLQVPLRLLEQQSRQQVEEAERRIRVHHRRRKEQVARQIERVIGQLRPAFSPQERVLNALPFLARHGYALREILAGEIDIELGTGDRWDGRECAP